MAICATAIVVIMIYAMKTDIAITQSKTDALTACVAVEGMEFINGDCRTVQQD